MRMRPDSPRWHEISQPEYAHEREALEHVRSLLPDTDPYRAWSNFEFVAEDGSVNEVDLLVAAPAGLFLVEIKSWPGRLTGDAGTWTVRAERTHTFDNPRLLASRKARKLKTLLLNTARRNGLRLRVPYVQEAVFLSSPALDCRLDQGGRHWVYGREPGDRDQEAAAGRRGSALPPIGSALLLAAPADEGQRLDLPTSRALARVVELAGIRPSRRSQQVGPYILEQPPFAEGAGWQDFLGVHRDLPDQTRRIRIYLVERAASREARATLLRAAQREYRILQGITHPGIVQVESYEEHERGPALVFRHQAGSMRLDHYLAERGAKLGVDARLSLVRQLAEAIRYAHDRHLMHRALRPQSVLVLDPDAPEPRVQITDWQTGARERTTSPAATAVSPPTNLERLIEPASGAYLAPEAISQPDPPGVTLDVFALGALAYLIFTGQPPAASAAELSERLRRDRGLQLSGVLDTASERLRSLVQMATVPDLDSRLDSAEEFLRELGKVEEELTDPTQGAVDPLDARDGDLLEGGLKVLRRLGAGSTALALEVQAGDRMAVLKVALDEDKAERLLGEAEVLRQLRDWRVVQLLKGPIEVAGHTALLVETAGQETLAQRLRERGPLSLDLLERFGEDLLETIVYLDGQGVAHRDIKPANLAIRPRPKDRQPHLALFDFSLSRAPVAQVHAGTPGYLDPFLGQPDRPRWDGHAERYAVAVTLYEMATGTLPVWGDGQSNPAMLDCEATIDAELFDRAVADPLTEFFTRALRRKASERFDTAEDMLRAWRAVFLRASAASPATAKEARESEADALAAAATLETPLAAAGLSARALSALERLGVSTVADLLAVPPSELSRLRGAGERTRRELRRRTREWRRRLRPALAAPAEEPPAPQDVHGLDQLAVQLLPPIGGPRTEAAFKAVYLLLGFPDTEAAGGGPGGRDQGTPAAWANQAEVAARVGVTAQRVGQILKRARSRWAKLPSLARLRDEIVTLLAAGGQVMGADELASGVLELRGTAAEGELRTAQARAAVRAAVEAESAQGQGARLEIRRAGAAVLVALEPDADGGAQPPARLLLDYAVALGRLADQLASAEPLLPPPRVLERLREVPAPRGMEPLPDLRLVRLAAAASAGAAASSRLELYPRGLEPLRALRLAQASLYGGAEEISEAALRERVQARFPEAAPLPRGRALDRLLAAAGLPLSRSRSGQSYVVERLAGRLSTVSRLPSRHTTRTGGTAAPATEAVRKALHAEERLRHSIEAGGFLALSVAPRLLAMALAELRRRFPVEVVDVTAVLLEAMRAVAAGMEVRWEVVVAADAAPEGSRDWLNLRRLVADAMPAVTARLTRADSDALLLTDAAPLARYGHMEVLERLAEAVSRPPARQAPPARTLWLLVPADEQTGPPKLDRAPVPVQTANQWLRLPEAWVLNEHRAHPRPPAATLSLTG
jgi:serine/threonine protein kinase